MNIDELKLALKVSHDSYVPLFIWGNQGIGKSMGVGQYTSSSFHFVRKTTEEERENGADDYVGEVPFGLVDLRCSQMEASEIRGLPEKDEVNQRVIYFAPGEMPRGEWINRKGEVAGEPGSENPGKENGTEDEWTLHRGVLFIDEVNRAQDDVLQAIFQLVYDRRVGDYVLPTGWILAAAGNPSGSKFTVNTFVEDAAFKDRFCHVFIDIDDKYNQSWVSYMTDLEGIDPSILTHVTQFGLSNPEHLCRADEDRENFSITPSPRTWEFVARVEQAILGIAANEKIDPEIIKNVRASLLRGLVGDLTNHFLETSIDILPTDIINHGLSKEQIRIMDKKMERNQVQALTWGVANYAKKLDTNSKEKMQNAVDFGKYILQRGGDNRDLAVAFFDIILETEQQSNIRRLSFANESLTKLMKKMNKETPWYGMINKDKDLAKLLHKSHRGILDE